MNRRLQRPVRLASGGGAAQEPSADRLKRCPKCGKSKPVTQFGSNPHRYDGRQSYCKPCEKNYQAQVFKAREAAPRGTGWWSTLSDHERADWLRERARSV